MNPDQISCLLVEAAALDDEVAGVLRIADDGWVVRFEAVDIEVGSDVERNRIILAARIGVPAAERRLSVLETLMTYNSLLRETGGVRIAMAGRDGDVVQMVDLDLATLLPRTLAVVLNNLAEHALLWRVFISDASADPDTAPAVPEDFPLLRV